MSRLKAAEIENIPMFEVQAVHAMASENGRHKQADDTGWCPGCKKDPLPEKAQAVGVFRVGDHLVWRNHTRINIDGKTHPCPCSGVRLCDAPPIVRTHGKERVEVCLCGKSNI